MALGRPSAGDPAPEGETGLPFITNYAPQDYDASPVNWAMIQDDRGFIYGGNQNGVLEFDGSSWRKITLPARSNVRSFTKDANGRVYVGGYGQLGYLDTDSLGQTIYVSINDRIPEEYKPYNDVWYLHSTPEGLYVNLHDKILLLGEEGQTKVWPSKTNWHVSAYINGAVYAREWESGLGKLTDEGFELLPGGERFAEERIYYLLPYDRQQLLIGTVNDGLFLFTGEVFVPFKTGADGILKDYEPYLPGAVLPGGRFALGTMGAGCLIIDRQGNLIQKVDRSSGLQDGLVLYPHVDRDGALWLGLSKGISRINTQSAMTYFGEQHGLEGAVTALRRFKGDLYVGTAIGVFRFDRKTNRFNPVQNIGGQCFRLLIFDGELLATNYLGVHRIEGENAFPIRKSVNRDFVPFNIEHCRADSSRLLVGLGEAAASLYKNPDGTWTDEGFWDIEFESSTNYSQQTAEGNLWLGLSNRVLYAEFDYASDIRPIKPVTKEYTTEDGLLGQNFSVWEVNSETKFLSDSGLFHFDESQSRFFRDTTFHQLADKIDDQTNFITDHLNRVWIVTNDELILAVPQDQGGYTYATKPFKQINDKIVSWVYPEKNGIVWIPTQEGLVRYDERLNFDYDVDFATLIRGVETGDGHLISAGALFEADAPVVDYENNSVQFQFSAPVYEQSAKTEFQSMLDGFDEQWSPWSNKRDRMYTNLHEGTYTFRVQARDVYGNLGAPSAFTFTIQPPWYRSWWAILVYILGGGAFVYGIVRIRTNQLKQTQRQLEQTVAERTGELKQRVEELAVINSVQGGLVAEMDMQGIYHLVGDKIRDIFDAQIVAIATFDKEEKLEVFRYLYEDGQKHYPDPRPIDDLRKYLIKNKKPVNITGANAPILKEIGYEPKAVPGTKLPKSGVLVPLLVGEKVRGYISLQNLDRENAFSDSNVDLLSTLCNSMSVALENARLFDETNRLLTVSEQKAAEMTTVNNVSKALASQLDLDTLIEVVGDQMRDLFKASIVYLALVDDQKEMINFPYQHGDVIKPIRFGEGLTSRIIKTGEAMLINKDINDSYVKLGIERKGKEAASYLGVPIPAGGENIGVLSVQSTEQENRFDENDRRLLSTIATHVGVAMYNARLFEQTLKAQAQAEESKKIAEEARQAAEAANEAKSAFLSTVSHELRTPLTSVIGFAKIIRKRLTEKIFPLVPTENGKALKTMEQVAGNLDVVVSEGERLTSLINDVLDLAKIEAGKMEWHIEQTNMGSVVEQAIAATSSMFDAKKLKLIKNIPEDLPQISGDRDKLVQVVINLLSNACKFTDMGSVTCSVVQEQDEVVVQIQDTGMGIAEEDKENVFEKFKQVGDTLTDKPKGTGLGLPICKEIVEYHGGRIWLDSTLGKGSVFSFSLPFKGDSAVAPTLQLDDLVKQLKKQVLHTARTTGEKEQTILVVDDEAHIRNLLKQELSDSGYVVREASNGREAIEEIRLQRPDLVILDVMMPEMNGFDVAAVLKNDPVTMDIPILILSIVQDRERGFRLGVDRYLTKPIDTDALFQEVGSLLEQGASRKRVMIVDENASTVKTLAQVLQTKGYHVVESNGLEMVKNAMDSKPDIIFLNSMLTDNRDAMKALRFEKGLENVLFLMYQ
jgi:signal transduction histidine kinase/DNA-binding response OmpR family regulator